MHAKWVEFLEQFPYVIKHKQGKMNLVVNALSRRHTLIVMLETKMLGLDCIKELYEKDIDFNMLLKGKRLCVPMSSIRQLFVKEAYQGGFMGHFGEIKTFENLNNHFYWPHMRKDVHNIYERCLTCKLAKSRVSPHGLYTLLPIPTYPWIDISTNFILGLPRSKRGFQRWPISFHVTRVIMLHTWPIFSLRMWGGYMVSQGPFLNRDTFSWTFLELGTKLLFSTTCHPQTEGQIEMSLRDWEDWIPHVLFAYNRVFNSTTSYSPFELAYGFNPLSPFDLFPFPIFPNCVNDEGLSKS
ncbi:hypothetical protein CR513_43557, partial [Mucuna pruriens]